MRTKHLTNWMRGCLLLAAAVLGHRTNGIAAKEPMEYAHVNIHSDFITAEGMWRVENPTKETEVILSDTEIECYRTGGVELVGSNAYCMQATANIVNGIPTVEVMYFPVLRWDKDQIIAADSSSAGIPICIWTQLTIDLRNKIVSATDTRKPGRSGLGGSCEMLPQTQTYYLLDRASEVIRRKVLQ